MDLQFSIHILSHNKDDTLSFYESINSVFENKIIKIREFHTLKFLFEGPENLKLFLPELEDFEIFGRNEGLNGEKYFFPSNEKITLFSYDQNETQIVPLVPGYYYFIVNDGLKEYYSAIEIEPKDLSIEEWRTMRNDIESKVIGLSTEFIKRKHSFSSKHEQEYVKENQLQKIQEFIAMIPRAMIAIDSLENDPNFTIKKEYSWKPSGSKALVDINSIKMINKHPEQKGMIYSPTRNLEYDIPENQWIKYILSNFLSFSKKSIVYLKSVNEAINSEEDKLSKKYDKSINYFDEHRKNSTFNTIKNDIKKLNSFSGYLYGVLDGYLFRNIVKDKPFFVPKSLVLSANYNSLYKLHLKITRNNMASKLVSEYKYYWRRTDLLYEIWTYTQIIDILFSKGYFPKSGWIFDINSNEYPLPFLTDETKVIMVKNEIQLQVVFNEKLKNEKFTNTLEYPLRTYSNRNKPDIRVDIFDSNRYTGSIILDAKYKRFPNIINQNFPESRKQREQLREYRNATSSSIIDLNEKAMEQLKVVPSVFAVYPRKDETRPAPSNLTGDTKIIFSELRPGYGFDQFSEVLNDEIESRLWIHSSLSDHSKI